MVLFPTAAGAETKIVEVLPLSNERSLEKVGAMNLGLG
jgi:hypothetical protein